MALAQGSRSGQDFVAEQTELDANVRAILEASALEPLGDGTIRQGVLLGARVAVLLKTAVGVEVVQEHTLEVVASLGKVDALAIGLNPCGRNLR